MARRNGGKFDTIAAQRAITGEDAVAAHGSRTMRVYALTKYIEQLQAK